MSKSVQKWLKIARVELNSAKALASLGIEHATTALFLCQQVAEKSIKAYLTSKNKKIKKVHDLNELIRDIEDNDLKSSLKESHVLTQYVAKFRYPQETDEVPTKEEVIEALGLAQKVYDLITKHIDAN